MRHLGRWRWWAPLLVLLVVAGFLAIWVLAPDDSKQADLGANGVGGGLVALALLLFERDLGRRDEIQQTLRLLASDTPVEGINLRGAQLCGVYAMHRVLSEIVLERADLRDAQLAQADMSRANLVRADLRKANLRFAVLSQADMRRADLRGANLGLADLGGADLSNARLAGAELFSRAGGGGPLMAASLRGSALYGTDLRDVTMIAADRLDPDNYVRVDLTDAVANEDSRWPIGFSAEAAGVRVLPGSTREPFNFNRAFTEPGWDNATTHPGAFESAGFTTGKPRSQDWVWMSREASLLDEILDQLKVLSAGAIEDDDLDDSDEYDGAAPG